MLDKVGQRELRRERSGWASSGAKLQRGRRLRIDQTGPQAQLVRAVIYTTGWEGTVRVVARAAYHDAPSRKPIAFALCGYLRKSRFRLLR